MAETAGTIRKAAVLGAGVMGAQIAAQLANAEISCLLLDILPSGNLDSADKEARNQVALGGLARIRKFRPPPFFVPELEKTLEIGNFEDDLGRLSEADLVIEAVVERLDVKRELLRKVEKARGKDTIVATNTSGLRISAIADGFSSGFRKHFLGMHFFNPPRYMKLLEITALPDTLPEVEEALSQFGKRILGKHLVRSKDTPNFIANRIGVFSVSYILHLLFEQGYSIEEVEALTGPLTGKPKSATFRTLDLIGLDTFADVSQNLLKNLPQDSMLHFFELPEPIQAMIQKRWVGEKAGQGFYKKVKRPDGESEILVLDFSTMEYRPRRPVEIPSLEMAKIAGRLPDRIKILWSGKDRGGEFFRQTTAAVLSYATHRIPEVCDRTLDIDRAMKWGFGWKLGPFELWDQLGFELVVKEILARGFSLPSWILEMADTGKRTFRKSGSFYDLSRKDYLEIPGDPEVIHLSLWKEKPSALIRENSSGSLIQLGEGVLGLDLHSKGNLIGEETVKIFESGLQELEKSYEVLVIGTEQEDFSLGANLPAVFLLAQEKEWRELEHAVCRFQQVNQKMKYSRKPVVVVPRGRALGGGCEVVQHASWACAYAETYIGLVEMGAGLIPAGGGIKEFLQKAMGKGDTAESGIFPVLFRFFEQAAYSKISSSALEAKQFGYLRDSDAICMNEDFLFLTAKREGLRLAKQGYVPPEPSALTALGKSILDPLTLKISKLAEEKKITEYEAYLAQKLAYVMSGGAFSTPQSVTEEHFLALERETFLSLCGERKTQERMKYLLENGKPLRN